MQKILWTAAALLSLSLVSARAADLTLYPSFAEIRESVQVFGSHFDWTPAADSSQFLIAGSLDLSDPSVTSLNVSPPAPNILALFEGKQVKVRFHDEFVPAKVIKADLSLFEIDGEFVQLGGAEVLYPNLEGVRYAPTFVWQRTGSATQAQLRYATTAVAWENTRYTLNMPDELSNASTPSSLIAWADIRNQSSVVYSAPKATLFAGDVLPQIAPYNYQQAQNRNINSFESTPGSTASPRSGVSSSGEVGGLQRFEYPLPLRLEAKSQLSLPFIRSSVTVRRVLEYTNEFDAEANFKTALQRTYRFVAPQGLPSGSVTVRENEQLVGQTDIGNTAQDTIVRVSVGKDFDIKINRNALLLERTEKIKRARIVFSVKNTKSRPINLRLSETLSDKIKLEASGAKGFKRVPGAFTLESEIAPGQTLSLTLLSTEVF